MAKLLINGGIFARISICPKIAAGFLIKEFTSSKQSLGGVVLSGALAEQDIFCYCTFRCSENRGDHDGQNENNRNGTAQKFPEFHSLLLSIHP